MKKCEEKIWTDDLGDGYSGYEICGGEYVRIGNINLYQCKSCKKVMNHTSKEEENLLPEGISKEEFEKVLSYLKSIGFIENEIQKAIADTLHKVEEVLERYKDEDLSAFGMMLSNERIKEKNMCNKLLDDVLSAIRNIE